MIELKCPYCNKTLHCGATLKSDEYLIDLYQCANSECESTEFLVGCKEFWDILGQLIRTRKALDKAKKENEDKQAVLNCVVDMLKTLNQKYALIMGKDVIKETVRLLEQNKGGDNE